MTRARRSHVKFPMQHPSGQYESAAVITAQQQLSSSRFSTPVRACRQTCTP